MIPSDKLCTYGSSQVGLLKGMVSEIVEVEDIFGWYVLLSSFSLYMNPFGTLIIFRGS
jgi:hypothetical protein